MNYKKQIQNNKLKELRLVNNLTQNDVASMLGFHTNERISKWESGTKIPNLVNLFQLAKIYEVNPTDLYPDLFYQLSQNVQKQSQPKA